MTPKLLRRLRLKGRGTASALALNVVTAEILRRIIFRDGLSTSLFNGNNFSCRLQVCYTNLVSNGWQGDDHWYLVIASRLREFQWLNANELWIFRLWPPGMGFIYAFVDLISLNLIGLYAILALLSWSIWLIIFVRVSAKNEYFSYRILTFFLFIVLVTSKSGDEWMFGPAISYSETLSIGFFCLFVLQLSTQKPILNGFLAGLLLTLSIYTRSVFDLFYISFVFLTILIVLLNFFYHFISKFRWKKPSGFKLNSICKMTITISCVVLLLTFPWRIYSHTSLTGKYTFNGNGDAIWANGWIPSERWVDAGNGYFVDVGINGFCQAYPSRCSEISMKEYSSQAPFTGSGYFTKGELRHIALEEIVSSPLPWLTQRIQLLQNASADALRNSLIGSLPYWILPLCFLVICFLVIQLSRRQGLPAELLLQFMCLVLLGITSIGPLFFASFESRYLFPFIYTFFVVGSLIISNFQKNKTQIKLD